MYSKVQAVFYQECRLDKIERVHSILTQARLARKETGKSILLQLSDIRQLGRYPGQCGVSDYYDLRLYCDDYLSGNGREDFIGWRLENDFSLALNPRHSVLPAWDKCVFTQLADGAGLPTIPTVACLHPAQTISGIFGKHLKSRSDVQDFLSDPGNYPLFGKPAFSQQGIGAYYLAGYAADSRMVLLKSGEEINIDSFIDRLFTSIDPQYHRPESGYLFQRPLEMHQALQRLTGSDTISSLRVVCLNGHEGTFPIAAIWKIAVPPNTVDNFSRGKYGNLVADIDLQTGKIGPLIGQFWPGAQLLSIHPVSKLPVSDTVIPHWADVLSVCKEAGRIFPLMKVHHWDIAITAAGPRILELNDQGALAFLQLHGKGLLGPEVRSFVRNNTSATQFPWVARL